MLEKVVHAGHCSDLIVPETKGSERHLLCRQITGFKWAALPEGTSVDCSLGLHDTGNLPWMIPRNISWHCEVITLQSAYIDYWPNELLNEWAIHCFFSIISYFWISCNHSITFEISVHTYGQTGGNLLIQAVLTQVRITYYPQIFFLCQMRHFRFIIMPWCITPSGSSF